MKRTILTVLMILGLVASTFATHKGAIFGTYVKYKSSTEVYIASGSGRCNDNEWNHYTESTLNLYSVLPTGEDFIYIYVDDSASSYPSSPVFIGSTTEPAWSDAQCGWYNGNDRCIGSVWCDSTGNIVEFQNNSSHEYVTDTYIKQVLSSGNPNGGWQTVETTAYVPVNATAVLAFGTNTDMTSSVASVSVSVASYEKIWAKILGYGTWVVTAYGWIPMERDASRDLQWKGADDDDNNFEIKIMGYRIER